VNLGVVESRALVQHALSSLLSTLKNHRVVLRVSSVAESFDSIRDAGLDVMFVSHENPADSLISASEIKKLCPEVKVLLLSDHPDEEFQIQAIEAGAWGCVPQTADLLVVEKALEVLERGELWMSRKLANRLLANLLKVKGGPEHSSDTLTAREWEILSMVANGSHNKEIANRLSISENTVKSHLGTIYRKLGVDSRVGATLHYFQQLRPHSRSGENS
jgi:DNA-binding NarL/FixJ family response regulator